MPVLNEVMEWMQMVDDAVDYGVVVDQGRSESFVEVMFARSCEEAATCRDLLQDHEIPARTTGIDQDIDDLGISVLVPDRRLEEAAELLVVRAQDFDDDDDDGIADDFDDDDEDEEDDDEDSEDFDDESDDDLDIDEGEDEGEHD